jgi:hypothetical protein
VAYDRPRLLHRRSELGYTDTTQTAMQGEPEAVPAEYQRRLTDAARRRQEAAQQEAWRRAHGEITDAVEEFKRDGHPDRRLLADVRAIERTASRVDRRLGLD